MSDARGFRRLLRIRASGEEVDQELQFHIDSRVDDLVRQGLTPDEARRRALIEFGDLPDTGRILRASRQRLLARRARADWRSDFRHDARVAWRGLSRRPGLAAALLLILGLATGATGAIFTVVRASRGAAMPYPDAGRLVHLWEIKGGAEIAEASWPDFLDWRSQSTDVFVGLEGYDPANVFVTEGGETRMRQATRATSGLFDLLGIRLPLGRGFGPGEDGPDGAPVVVLSHAYWRDHFGGDPGVLQRALQINGQPHTIIGVLPERFHFAVAGGADFWLPMDQIAQTRSQRFNHWLRVVGRLKDGVTLSSARTTMGTVMARLESAYPESNSGRGISLVSLREQVTGGLRPVLIALALAVTLVLAIACANAAGLLLSRTLGRGRELAVRMAIGASRGRIVRQLLTESLLIGVGGAVLGILVARIGIGYLVGGMDRGALEYLPFLRDLRPDALTIGFLGLLAMVVGLASGLAPALVGARADVGYPVAGGHPTANRRSGHLRDGLVAGQLALTLALLTGTALVGRSLLRLLSQDLGFKAEEVVTGRVALSGPAWQQGAAQQRFFENLLERVRAIPGVRTVGAISNLPLNDGGTNTFRVEGEAEPDQAAQPEGTRRQVAGDYFQAMGIPLLAGRLFTARDDSTAQPALVLSAALAKRWFPGGVAVGRRVRFYAFPDTTWEVIGVVGDVTVGRIDAEAPPIFYMTHLQVYDNRLTLTIRSAASGVAILPALRTVLATMGPGVALYYEAPMSAVVSDSPAIVARRYPLRVIGAFAAIALLLAITGVYGVVANGVAERRRELGIRSALGATAAQLVSLIMRRGGGLIAAGIVSGGVLALVFSRTLGSMLYGIRPGDPATLVVVIGLLALTALLATWWPARRAGRVDPAEALRSDG